MSLLYALQKQVFRFIGDIKWSGWKRPFWFTINGQGYMIKGEHYRELIKIIEPGDILLRRFEGYVDKWFIPGYMNHAGLYIGDDGDKPEQVVHAISEGVLQEDLLNFMRTDHLRVLRLDKEDRKPFTSAAIVRAKNVVGAPYDFGFDFDNADRFSCTELVAYCYPKLVKGKKRFGKMRIVADDFMECNYLKVVWNSDRILDTYV